MYNFYITCLHPLELLLWAREMHMSVAIVDWGLF
jgi:hypothetical protein